MPHGGTRTHILIKQASADLVYEIIDMKYRWFGEHGLGTVDTLIKTKYVRNTHNQNSYLFVLNTSRKNYVAFDYSN